MKVKTKDLIFVLSTIFSGLMRLYPLNVSVYFTNGVALTWILLSYTHHVDIRNKKSAKLHFKLSFYPVVAMIIYTFTLWLFNPPGENGNMLGFYTRLASTSFFLVLSYMYIYRAYLVFGSKVFSLVWQSMIASYFVFGICWAIMNCGLIDVLKNMILLADQSLVNKYLEVHDLTFALGFYLLFFLIFGNKFNISNLKIKVLITILFIWMGYKRIEIFALLCVFLFYNLFDKYAKKGKRKYIVPGVIFILVAFLFLVLIYSGCLQSIAKQYGINFNYRLDTWSYWVNKSELSPIYFGKGMNYIDKQTYILHNSGGLMHEGYIVLSGMHSDLLKKYIELGFLGFFSWVIYFSIIKTKILYKKQGYYISEIYLLLTIYIVILYITDNVFNYFLCNICYILIPMVTNDFVARKSI